MFICVYACWSETNVIKPLHTVVSKNIGHSKFVPLNPLVDKSCNIECFGNIMHQIVVNKMAKSAVKDKSWTTTQCQC